MSPTWTSPMSVGFTHSKVPTGAARPIDGVRTVNHMPPVAHHHTATTLVAANAVPRTARAIREASGVRRRRDLGRRDAADDPAWAGDPRGSQPRPDASLMARGLAAGQGCSAPVLLDRNPGADDREACARAGRGGRGSPSAHTRPPGWVCSCWSPTRDQTCVKVQVIGWSVVMPCRVGEFAVLANAVVKVQST